MDDYRETWERLDAIMEEAGKLAHILFAIVETDSDDFNYASIGAANEYCADDMAAGLKKNSDAVRELAVSLKRNHGLG